MIMMRRETNIRKVTFDSNYRLRFEIYTTRFEKAY